MVSKSEEKKIQRKQKRCQYLISEETKIACIDTPTKFLVVCNAGLSTGLQQDILLETARKYGQVVNIQMLSGKSYCFLECLDIENAESIFGGMHGHERLAQNNGIIYLSYSEKLPQNGVENWSTELPPGLILLEEFLTESEEINLLNCINWDNLSDTDIGSSLKHRMVKHYGYEFIYGANNVNPNTPLAQKIPEECSIIWSKFRDKLPTLEFNEPDQLTVNRYESGQGIPPHVDTHSAFTNVIMSLSLGSDVSMEFRNPENGQHLNVFLPKRSLLVMTGESRYGWTHGITPRKTDIIRSTEGSLIVRKRDVRVSFTFRKLSPGPCRCEYKLLCDSYKNNQESNKITDNPSKLELENVHKVYNEIANHFSETRHSPWPEVERFIESFSFGEILVDIGCGNGKYLSLNKDLLKIGCDRSERLLSVCRERELNVFQCDCLQVPVKSASVDGCISIAVIHHLSTKDRRVQAIKEMSRILVTGGRGLIYVWAKDQQLLNKKSSYLRQNKRNNKATSDDTTVNVDKIEYSDGLPIHTNRTQFVHQDVLVPWKKKDETGVGKETFLRFYHVFEEHELEKLCCEIQGLQVLRSYYDQGNWCVEFQKE